MEWGIIFVGLVLFLSAFSRSSPVKGNFANPAHFSGFIAPIAAIPIFLRESRYLMLPWLFFFILLIALLLSGAWGGVVSLFFSFSIFIYLHRSKWKAREGIIFAGTLILFFLLSFYAVFEGTGRYFSLKSLYSSFISRLEMFVFGLKASLKFFPLGSGIGSFRWIFPSFYRGNMKGEFPALHSEYLETLLTLGVVPFIILLSGLACLFKFYTKEISARKYGMMGTRSAAFLALLVLSVHSAFDFLMHLPAISFLFAVLLGIFRGEDSFFIIWNLKKSRLPFSFLFLSLSFVFFLAFRDYRKVESGVPDEPLLLSSPFLSSSYIEKGGDIYYLAFKKTGDREFLQRAFLIYERCTEVNPRNYRCFHNLGVFSLMMGDEEAGERYLRKAVLFNPLNPFSKFILGCVLLRKGEAEGVRLTGELFPRGSSAEELCGRIE